MILCHDQYCWWYMWKFSVEEVAERLYECKNFAAFLARSNEKWCEEYNVMLSSILLLVSCLFVSSEKMDIRVLQQRNSHVCICEIDVLCGWSCYWVGWSRNNLCLFYLSCSSRLVSETVLRVYICFGQSIMDNSLHFIILMTNLSRLIYVIWVNIKIVTEVVLCFVTCWLMFCDKVIIQWNK